jgi:putative DNA primase/helicase
VLVAAKGEADAEGNASRLFLRAKSNIGPDDGGFTYDLHQGEVHGHSGVFSSYVGWGEAVEGSARDLLATAEATTDEGGDTVGDAKRFLSDLMADGPLPTKAIKADSEGAGFSWATIRRAQKAMGIEPEKQGGTFGGGKQQWVWRMPNLLKVLTNPEDAQQNSVSTFNKSEHLQEKLPDSEMVEGEV